MPKDPEQASRKVRQDADLPSRSELDEATDIAVTDAESERLLFLGQEVPDTIARGRQLIRTRIQRVSSGIGGKVNLVEYVTREEMKLGGYDSIVMGPEGARTEVRSPDSPGFNFSSKGSELKPGPSMQMGVDVSSVAFLDRIMNPRAKHAPPNLVNVYPLMMNEPPGIMKGRTRVVIKAILHLVRILENIQEP